MGGWVGGWMGGWGLTWGHEAGPEGVKEVDDGKTKAVGEPGREEGLGGTWVEQERPVVRVEAEGEEEAWEEEEEEGGEAAAGGGGGGFGRRRRLFLLPRWHELIWPGWEALGVGPGGPSPSCWLSVAGGLLWLGWSGSGG